MTVVRPVATPEDLALAKALFLEYRDTPGVAECVVSFDDEVRSLPGPYELILLAEFDNQPIGCAALRDRGGHAEMKRLYTRPEARGSGAGRALATAIIDAARQRGYRLIRLDTLPTMSAAIALYSSLGFRRTKPYYEGAPADALFYELPLA